MHEKTSWAQAACSCILRPVIRLALAMGLKHLHLDRLLRELLLEEARRLWVSKGVKEPNISQLAMTTGLNRKDVTARVRGMTVLRPHFELSLVARVFTAWFQLATENPENTRLPLAETSHGTSFEALAKRGSGGNVHHRAVLDELIRLGMVVEHEGYVELVATGFVPARDLQSMLTFLGSNVGDHLQAAVSNTLDEKPPLLERAVFAHGLTSQECERIHQLMRRRWDALHHELVKEMTGAVERSRPAGNQRIKVGIYALYEGGAELTLSTESNKAEEKSKHE